jgi:hypothetical protein
MRALHQAALLIASVVALSCGTRDSIPLFASPASGITDASRRGSVTRRLVERQGELMTSATAAAFDRMEAAARADGVRLIIRDGYRSYAEQVAVAKRHGLFQHGGRAAIPGTSPHGSGTALDIDDGLGYRWLLRNAPRFGFDATVPGEPWHWEIRRPAPLSLSPWRSDESLL